MSLDLHAEAFAAVERVRKPHLRRLEAAGVPLSAIMTIGRVQPPFGVHRVREGADGLWEPDEDGRLCAILPVVVPRSFDWFEHEIDTVEIIDLIAFHTSAPLRWSWRTGDGWALGADLLDEDLPVTLVTSPLEWLAKSGQALCLLDWSSSSPAWSSLRGGPPLQFADDALRQRVRNALIQSAPMPQMETLHAA